MPVSSLLTALKLLAVTSCVGCIAVEATLTVPERFRCASCFRRLHCGGSQVNRQRTRWARRGAAITVRENRPARSATDQKGSQFERYRALQNQMLNS